VGAGERKDPDYVKFSKTQKNSFSDLYLNQEKIKNKENKYF